MSPLERLNWVLDTYAGTSTAKLVLLVLVRRANRLSEAWPAVERIAGAASLNRRTVQRTLAALVRAGIIGRMCVSGRRTPTYVMRFEAVPLVARGGTVSPQGRRKAARSSTVKCVDAQNPHRIHGILACHLCGKHPSATDSPGSMCLACARRERSLIHKRQGDHG